MTDTLAAAASAAFFRGQVPEALALLAGADSSLPLLLARAKIHTHLFFLDSRPPDQPGADAAAALAWAQRLGDRHAEIDARTLQGNIAYYVQLGRAEPDYAEARGHFEAALALAGAHGRPQQVAAAHFFAGLVQQMTRQAVDAEASFRRAYELARACGAKLEQSYAIRHIGFYQRSRGEFDAALASFRESIALREAIDLRVYLSLSYLALAETHFAAGDLPAARDAYRHAEQWAAETGFLRPIALVANSFGEFLAAAGESDAARGQLERAIAYGRRANHAVVVKEAEGKLKGL